MSEILSLWSKDRKLHCDDFPSTKNPKVSICGWRKTRLSHVSISFVGVACLRRRPLLTESPVGERAVSCPRTTVTCVKSSALLAKQMLAGQSGL